MYWDGKQSETVEETPPKRMGMGAKPRQKNYGNNK